MGDSLVVREPPIVPSGRQDLNLRPLDPQGRRTQRAEQLKPSIRTSRRDHWEPCRNVSGSSRPIPAPDALRISRLQKPPLQQGLVLRISSTPSRKTSRVQRDHLGRRRFFGGHRGRRGQKRRARYRNGFDDDPRSPWLRSAFDPGCERGSACISQRHEAGGARPH